MDSYTNATAIVMGGSIAGLLAARVLAERFGRVVIVERDCLPQTAAHRRGVPHGRHAHALLGQGKQIIEQLLPGLTDALIAQGAPLGRGRLFSGGGYFARHPHAPPTLYASRPLLEAEVRCRVLALRNVELCAGYTILGFETNHSKQAVSGIRVQPHDCADDRLIHGDLVVDATGRGSRTPAWLEAIGYQKPQLEQVEVDMGYASRLYERRPGDLCGDLMINIAPTPRNPRACGMLAQEGNRWLVTLAGYFGDHPPTDDDGFLAFARKLPTGDVYDLISSARPLGDAQPYRFVANQRRRYESLRSFPAGLLVLGDALCSFTPIYGQGMSVAAMQAIELRACLQHEGPDLVRAFFKNVAAVIDNPWSLTVGNDRRLAAAPQPLPRRALNWYMARFQHAAHHDPELALAFQRVGNLVASPASLLHPRLAVRVLGARV